MTQQELKDFLNKKVTEYNRPEFIENDPISIPHQFSIMQDIEIAGFFAAVFAWGQRKTIIKKCNELMNIMGHRPYDFILNHSENDLKPVLHFKHRTFNATDALYFISVLHNFYTHHNSLESIFVQYQKFRTFSIEKALTEFHEQFFDQEDHPERTKKHIATPARNSTCKRLNMFLRWMVRQDDCGVDFGIWKKIPMSALICPCDVHVDRVARTLGLITSKQTNWKTAVELTEHLKKFDNSDPVKYDYALFGLGVMEKF